MPHEANKAPKRALGVVAGAAIPAAVLGSLAMAPAAQAAPQPSALQPGAAKAVTPLNIKIAEQQIKAQNIPTRFSTLGLPAKASTSEIKIPAGATLLGLAAEYNTTVDKLKALNNLKSDRIIAGKYLKVPGKSSSSSKSSNSSSSGTSSYKIKSGDTLSGIAKKHKMSLSDLLSQNNLSASDTIYPGKVLKVYGASGGGNGSARSISGSSQGGGSSTYTVKSGDTLGGIAYSNNMSLSSLLSKNGMSASTVIRPGDKIKVKGSSNSKSTSKNNSSKTSGSQGSYTVKPGDTLSGIASKHGMSLETLMSLNGLSKSSTIFPKDKLKVSGSTSSSKQAPKKQTFTSSKTSTYTVKSGDTLSTIANSHGMKLAALLDLNPEYSAETNLQIGDKLKISGSSVKSTSTNTTTKRKVGNSMLGRVYEDHVVDNANKNKDYLDSKPAPSRAEMKSIISSTAKSMGVDPALALAHAQQESGFDMRAVSPANAIGAMQVIPSTGEWMSQRLGRQLDLTDPHDNAAAGIALISFNLDNTENLDIAIASYYQGLQGVKDNGMYADTKNYVASVKAHMKSFR